MLTSTKISSKKTGDRKRINFAGTINSNPAEFINPGKISGNRKSHAF